MAKPSWPAIGGYIAGMALLVIWLVAAPTNWIALVGAVFLIALGLFAPRLEELSAGREGFKAKMFQQSVVERLAQKTEAKPEPVSNKTESSPIPWPHSDVERGGIPSVVRPHGIPSAESLGTPDIVVSDKSTGAMAFSEIKDAARARTPEEFADQLFAYFRSTEVGPKVRGLSPSRIRLEQDLFGAILEYQSDLFRSPKPQFGAYEGVVRAEIQRFWNHAEELDDQQVADLAGRIRRLHERRLQEPPAPGATSS